MAKKPQKDEHFQPRAVIYARYSSSGQRDESIEGQLRDCYEFARKNGLNVIGEYTDRALTGKTDKRPDFQRMLRDSERTRRRNLEPVNRPLLLQKSGCDGGQDFTINKRKARSPDLSEGRVFRVVI